MITVESLRYDYPERRALDDVGFTLDRGSITALVGPNGAGKTTLLRCLAALDEPHAGRIRIDGVDVLATPRLAHARLGFLPDHFGLYGSLSAQRCLEHAGASRGLAATALHQRVSAVAGQVGLADKLGELAGSLSRGQRQRLALAQSIIHQPAVLLLDEPASGLDPEARSELSQLMRTLAATGMTLIVSSHILAELEEYCTGMLVLREGRLLEHRVLAVSSMGSHGSPTRRLHLQLAHAITPEALSAACGTELQLETLDGLQAQISTNLPDTALPALLLRLLQADVPVCGFSAITESLQDAYLATVQSTPRGRS